MHGVQIWASSLQVRGLVDLAYRVRVRAGAPPVLPDGRAGIVWLSDGTVRVCGPERRPWRPDRIGLDVVGVRLTLGAVPMVLGVPASTLSDTRLDLRELWGGPALELAGQLNRAPGSYARALVLQEAIRARCGDRAVIEPLTRHVARRLARGEVRVHQLAAEIGLSERQLRRRCQHAFGYPPAVLARLLRLHRFLDLAKTARRGTGIAALAAAAGYADQSHLTRESQALTGRRPSVFLNAAAPVSEPFKTEPWADS